MKKGLFNVYTKSIDPGLPEESSKADRGHFCQTCLRHSHHNSTFVFVQGSCICSDLSGP